MIPLAVAAVLLFQQQVPQRLDPSAGGYNAVQTESRQAIMDVGRAIAEMRSAHDLLRRAAFNQSDALVMERTQQLQRHCRDVTAVARAAPPRVCRTCFDADIQRAMNGYRAVLPSVGRVGARCASQLAQFLRAKPPAAAVRRGVGAVSRTLVEGLGPYEARVEDVRRSFGLVGRSPMPTPRR